MHQAYLENLTENLDRPDSDFETVKILRMPFTGKLRKVRITTRPDYVLLPVDNGGKLLVKLARFKDKKYLGLLNYWEKEKVLPVEVINPIVRQIGIPGTNVDNISRGEIVSRGKIDYFISQILLGAKKGIKLLGAPGTGKTTAFAYICQELLTKSNGRIRPASICYVEMEEILTLMRDKYKRDDLNLIMVKPYLFIDEFLQGTISPRDYSEFHWYFNHRYGKPQVVTFIATNKSKTQLEETEGYRAIYSRLCDDRRFFPGEDIGNFDKRKSPKFDGMSFGDLTGFHPPSSAVGSSAGRSVHSQFLPEEMDASASEGLPQAFARARRE